MSRTYGKSTGGHIVTFELEQELQVSGKHTSRAGMPATDHALSLKIQLWPDGRLGRGKVELLENIAAFGSISAGARQMNMSYKRAWDLVEEMNRLFGQPVVSTQTGGKRGGGAQLTPTGLAIVGRFRAIERAAEAAAAPHIAALKSEIQTG